MKDSIWGYLIVMMGVFAIACIFVFQNITNTDQHNYSLLRETTEAAMYDSLDVASYYKDGETIRIDQEKFVENFIRRFAENASLSNTYKVEIFDINEEPPKVSIRISSTEGSKISETIEFDIVNKIDAIIETKK